MSGCNSVENINLTYYEKTRDVILNRAKGYYENDKEGLRYKQEINTETYLKKKNKKREYGKNRYYNISEEKKIRLKGYKKNYHETKKSQYNNE